MRCHPGLLQLFTHHETNKFSKAVVCSSYGEIVCSVHAIYLSVIHAGMLLQHLFHGHSLCREFRDGLKRALHEAGKKLFNTMHQMAQLLFFCHLWVSLSEKACHVFHVSVNRFISQLDPGLNRSFRSFLTIVTCPGLQKPMTELVRRRQVLLAILVPRTRPVFQVDVDTSQFDRVASLI